MDTPPLPEAPASTGLAKALSPSARAAAGDMARALADPGSDAAVLRTAAKALLAALDADAADTIADPFRHAGFDRAALAQLFALTGPEVARDLLLRLAEDLQTARAALALAGACPPAQVLRAQAHVLVGLGGSVGATRLHDAAHRLGQTCRAGSDAPTLSQARDEVVAAIDAALAFLAAQGPALPARLAAGA
jgi:HPt (histidine-containing phosphotransfer) domain-containing protein